MIRRLGSSLTLLCFRLGILAVLPASSPAQTATGTIGVSATVIKVCTLSATALGFGTYNASSATANDAAATISVTCTNGTTYEVGLDVGLGSGATSVSRKMTYLTNTLTYQVFRDSGRSLSWGSTTLTDMLAATGLGSLVTHTVYGRIPAAQYVTPGAYVDTLTISVVY